MDGGQSLEIIRILAECLDTSSRKETHYEEVLPTGRLQNIHRYAESLSQRLRDPPSLTQLVELVTMIAIDQYLARLFPQRLKQLDQSLRWWYALTDGRELPKNIGLLS